MSGPIIPSSEPQNEQHTAQPDSQDSRPAQAYQNPQGIQPQPQGSQIPLRSFGGPGMNEERVAPAVWVYEITMGVVQTLIGLVLILAGNQLVYFFGGGYGLLGRRGVISLVIFTLIGFALIVTGSSRPLKLLR